MNKIIMKNSLLLIATSSLAFSTQIPNAGNILQQVKHPVISTSSKKLPVIKTQHYTPAISGKNNIKILVKKFTIKGNSVFPSSLLHNLIKDYENKKLTLLQIKKVADIITQYYRNHSYFVARAYIPAQTIKNGTLKIMIIEGHYGNFHLKNSSLVRSSIIENYLNQIKNSGVISLDTMDHQMLLINDLSGAKIVNIQINPGKKIGESDFYITTEAQKRFNTYLSLDNYGTKGVGKNRVTVAETINSPTGLGDQFQIIGLRSLNNGLKNVQGKYILPLGTNGLKADIDGSYTKYKLGDIYKSLDAHGDISLFQTGLSYPLIKTNSNKLNIKGVFSYTGMSDWISGTNAKKHINDFILSLDASHISRLFKRSNIFSADISFTRGHLYLDNTAAKSNDASLNSEGNFNKAVLNMSNSLALNKKTTLKMGLKAQTSFNKNIDSSQDLSVGGAYGLRAYSSDELSGDKGMMLSLENIYALPTYKNLRHNISAFIDSAKVWKNANDIVGVTDNVRRLNDIGVSYSANYKVMNLSISYAHGFGKDSKPMADPSSSANKVFAKLSVLF